MNPSEALKTHLRKSAAIGSPSAILFAQIALFTATIFAWRTRLFAKYDSTGCKMALSYHIIAVLVSNSRLLSHFGFIHRTCGYKVNSIANLICLVLAIVLEKFYEKSLRSLGFALSIMFLLLILLVIIQPSTDLGLFSLLSGVIGSIAYNLFGFKFQTWIVVAICSPLVGFRFWLDNNWLDVPEDELLVSITMPTRRRNQISKSEIIEAVTVGCFQVFWLLNLFITNCREEKGPPKSITCSSSSIMGMLACVLIFIVYSLFQRKLKKLILKREREWREERLERLILKREREWREEQQLLEQLRQRWREEQLREREEQLREKEKQLRELRQCREQQREKLSEVNIQLDFGSPEGDEGTQERGHFRSVEFKQRRKRQRREQQREKLSEVNRQLDLRSQERQRLLVIEEDEGAQERGHVEPKQHTY